MPASVTMKDETFILVTHQPCQAPISMPDSKADDHGGDRIDIELHRQHRHDHADQRHCRADRQVEVARDDQHHRADRGQRDDGRLQRKQDQVALRQERAVGGEIEEDPDHSEHQQQRRIAQRAVGQQAGNWRCAPQSAQR